MHIEHALLYIPSIKHICTAWLMCQDLCEHITMHMSTMSTNKLLCKIVVKNMSMRAQSILTRKELLYNVSTLTFTLFGHSCIMKSRGWLKATEHTYTLWNTSLSLFYSMKYLTNTLIIRIPVWCTLSSVSMFLFSHGATFFQELCSFQLCISPLTQFILRINKHC